MRLPGRHHRNRHAPADGMKTTDQAATTKVRFAPSLRTAAELLAEREGRDRTAG